MGSVRRAAATAALLCVAAGAPAQDSRAGGRPDRPAAAPFGPGERAEYRVTLGLFGSVGEGAMEVLGLEEVEGHTTYHMRLSVEGGIIFAHVDDEQDSWMDVEQLFSRRFLQNLREVGHRRHRRYDLYPEEQRWASYDFPSDFENGGELHTDAPQDDVSFLYFVRTLNLTVGETYIFNNYFKERGNPVQLKVLRRDTVEVDAGTFPVIIVQPIIQTEGLFGEGGHAEVAISDDPRRLVVQLKSSVPVIGSLNLYLKSYTPGQRMVQRPFGERIPPP